MVTNINFADDFLDQFTIRPIPPELGGSVFTLKLVFPAKDKSGKSGVGVTTFSLTPTGSKANSLDGRATNVFKESLESVNVNKKLNSEWEKIKRRQIVPQIDAYTFWKQCERDIMRRISMTSRDAYSMLNSIDKIIVRDPYMFAAIGPNMSKLAATGTPILDPSGRKDRKGNPIIVGYDGGIYTYQMIFNPSNLLLIALDFYFYYRSYFKSFRDAFVFTYAFVFIHETLHVSMNHFTTKDASIVSLSREPNGPAFINKVTDMTINLKTTKRLSYLTKGVALRPVSAFSTDITFSGYPSPNFSELNTSKIAFKSILSSLNVSPFVCEFEDDSLVEMSISISPDFVDNYCNGSSIQFLSLVKSLRDYFLVNAAPYVESEEGASSEPKLPSLEPSESYIREFEHRIEVGHALGKVSDEDLAKVQSIVGIVKSQRNLVMADPNPDKLSDYADLIQQQIGKLVEWLKSFNPVS